MLPGKSHLHDLTPAVGLGEGSWFIVATSNEHLSLGSCKHAAARGRGRQVVLPFSRMPLALACMLYTDQQVQYCLNILYVCHMLSQFSWCTDVKVRHMNRVCCMFAVCMLQSKQGDDQNDLTALCAYVISTAHSPKALYICFSESRRVPCAPRTMCLHLLACQEPAFALLPIYLLKDLMMSCQDHCARMPKRIQFLPAQRHAMQPVFTGRVTWALTAASFTSRSLRTAARCCSADIPPRAEQ